MRKLDVPAAPSTGNKLFAIDAPPCTLIMDKSTAGMAGNDLFPHPVSAEGVEFIIDIVKIEHPNRLQN